MKIEAIRARIQQRLDILGISRETASKDAGLSAAYLKQFMSGRQQDITISKLDALAAALKTSPVWLMTGEGDVAVQLRVHRSGGSAKMMRSRTRSCLGP